MPRKKIELKHSLIISTLLCLSLQAGAGDWPQWRGPDRNGISKETGWLDRWPDAGPPIAWKSNVGLGYSSMVVADGRLFTLGHKNNQDTVYCFDAETGKEIWKHSYDAELGDKYFEGGTTGTPTVDGDRVYSLSRWGDLFCFEAATGKIVWSKNIQKETNVRIPTWGFSGAPLVHENLLVLNIGDAGMAVDKGTGKIVWQSENKDAGYSTPLPVKRGNQWLALLGNGNSYVAVDPKSGKEAWRLRWVTQYGVNAADPVVTGEQIFISTGYGKGGTLVKMKDGEPETIWKTKALRTQMNPAVLLDGHLYGIDGDTTEKATLKCIELSSGTEKWSEAGIGSGGLIAADGKLIVLSDRSELMVAPATPSGFKPTSRAQVLGGKCWTAPVLANGRIYCRNSRGDIACVDVRAKK